MLKARKAVLFLLAFIAAVCETKAQELSRERMVFQTDFGDIHMAFYPDVAPVTVAHIRKLGELGAYNTNHIFRVDPGFVAQVADIVGNRIVPLNSVQQAEAAKTVPLEVTAGVKHDKRGILSMGRFDNPNSGTSSFSILLGPAPHLDMQYTIFGEVTKGWRALNAIEKVQTRKEGIFVMPLNRITILSTYMYLADDVADGTKKVKQLQCFETLADLQQRYDAQAIEIENYRQQRLPGN